MVVVWSVGLRRDNACLGERWIGETAQILHVAEELADTERAELCALAHLYQEGPLRKARALREAVRRGLREPLEP
jgi:hypothetical protein